MWKALNSGRKPISDPQFRTKLFPSDVRIIPSLKNQVLSSALLFWAPVLMGCQTAIKTDRANPRSIPNGRSLYTTYCQSCHGVDGKNDRNGANTSMKLVSAIGMPHAQWWRIVADGKGEMPSFSSRISEAEALAIQSYISQLEESNSSKIPFTISSHPR